MLKSSPSSYRHLKTPEGCLLLFLRLKLGLLYYRKPCIRMGTVRSVNTSSALEELNAF